MPNDLASFAIHADDCNRAKTFYAAVFGWHFEPWGPPDFYLITTSPQAAVRGLLHQRQHPVAGQGMIGFECTIAVADIRATTAAIAKAGGTVTTQPYTIEGVGTVVRFEDTEGNHVSAMEYVKGVRG